MIQKIKFSECVKYMIKGPFGSDMKKSLYVPKGDNTYKVYIQGNAIQQDGTLGEYYVTEEYFHKKLERFEVHPGDYIITCDGTLGKYLKLGDNIERGVISSSLLLLKLDEDKIYDKYFELLWEYSMLGYLASQARNACLIHLPSAKAIGEVEIELPPMDVQIDIANKAYAIKNICYNRVEEICMLDELIKARFVELFGDLMENPLGWPVMTIADVSTFLKSGLSRKLSDDDIGLPVIRSGNIQDGQFIFDDVKYWYIDDPQGANTKDYILKDGDVLVNFINSSSQIGKTAIYRDTGRDCIYTTNIFRMKLADNCNEYYYNWFAMSDYYYRHLQSIIQPAVNQASFTTVNFLKLPIPLPPKEKQGKFADFVKQVDKSKVVKLTT